MPPVEQEYLDSFAGKQEFWYASKDAGGPGKGSTPRQDDKWWLPTVRVPPDGLSVAYSKWLQNQKDLVAQVLKAAMAINANVLMEMEVPESYTESLPKVIIPIRPYLLASCRTLFTIIILTTY